MNELVLKKQNDRFLINKNETTIVLCYSSRPEFFNICKQVFDLASQLNFKIEPIDIDKNFIAMDLCQKQVPTFCSFRGGTLIKKMFSKNPTLLQLKSFFEDAMNHAPKNDDQIYIQIDTNQYKII